MPKILTADQMREIDRLTIEERGVAGLVLMENAGLRVCEFLAEEYSPLEDQRVVILCGMGNNGGDGLVVARHLVVKGLSAGLRAVLLGDPERLKGDAAANYKMLRAVDFEPAVVLDSRGWQQLRPKLLPATLVVDALLGTGLRGPAEGLLLEVIRDLNENFQHVSIVAVDMPSGLPSDSGEPLGEAVRARHTVTFTAPKVSQIFPPNCQAVGDLRVAPIGTAPSVLAAIPDLKLSLAEPGDFTGLFVPRERSAHKGDFGHVLVIGGSRATPGAVLMAGTSALRAGAGLVTVATAESATPALVSHTPELMTLPVPEDDDGSMMADAFQPIWTERATVVALGPGIGTKPANQEMARRIVREVGLPMVVDADGLTALASNENDWGATGRVLVLTPHPGEMSRLTGLPVSEIQKRRVEIAREFAQRRGVYLVLKGYRTLTATPDGRVLVNPTGTPGMASGGSGDILTGMIAGLLAQFADEPPERVIAAAVYLHGLAAELATEQGSEQSTLATDILTFLPNAICRLRE